MFQCRCEIDVAAPPEVVFGVLWDAEHYPDFMTDVIDVEVHADSEPWTQELTQFVTFIRTRHYRVRMHATPHSRIAWKLVEGENLAVNDGAWDLSPLDSGTRCHLTYQLQLDVTVPIPDVILRRLAEFNLPTMLRQVQARAETQARRPSPT
ncbi:MAG: SRPBCC family protein [Myxococcota bacterium]